MCSTNDLCDKIVISVCDGRKLGYICNFGIDPCEGKIHSIFVPGDCGFLGLGRNEDIRIPWDKIKKIGEDAILVDIPPLPDDCTVCCPPPPKKRRWFC